MGRTIEPLAGLSFAIAALVACADWGFAEASTATPDPTVQAPDDLENEIIVMAERAKTVRFKFNIDDRTRRVKCKIVRSSGDKAFDNAMCEPIRRCAKVEPFDAPTVEACIERERGQVFRELALSRRQK